MESGLCSIICVILAFLSWILLSSNHFVGFRAAENKVRSTRKRMPNRISLPAFRILLSVIYRSFTVAAFRAFVNDSGYLTVSEQGGERFTWRKPGNSSLGVSFTQEDTHPVCCLSWFDAQAYVRWLNENYARAGERFQLPSEEHWEYACRANSTGWDGVTASDLTGMAWYDANAGKVTHPVGRRAPNGWGLYDMHGNVSEWCADAYGDYTNAGAPKSNGSSFVSDRVRRGGGWLDGARYCRAACRGRGTPGEKSNTVGFRLELTDFSPESMIPEPKPQPVQPKVPSITEQSISPSGSRKAGTVKTISIAKVKVKFRWCPPGEFFMGSPVTEDGRYDDEILRKVRLVRGFWMAEMETTQKLWDSVMGNNPSSFRGSNLLPVECVSWDECQEFVDRIQRYAPKGMKFRLPTETHWEYACRAGTRGEYNVSDEDLYGLAYYEKNSGRKTHSVGGKIPNAWGLCDMHGNVSEWCYDAYAPYTSKSAPKNTDLRVTRGGNWGSDARDCRSARRDMFPAGSVNDDIGFRVELVYASE